jgi:hypothetical protein
MSVASTGTGLRWDASRTAHRASGAGVRFHSLPLDAGFFFFIGFIVTQAFTIPVAVLPTNWALWPSLPDVFGFGLVLAVLSGQPARAGRARRLASWHLWVLLLYSLLSFVMLTLPQSGTGVGIKYGGFTLVLYLKYILVAWAASRVPLDEQRVKWTHRATFVALVWVAATSLAARFGLLDLQVFISRLPAASSGRWAGALDSTVGTQNQTPITMLLLSGLALATTDHRKRWVTTAFVIALGTLVAVLTGSRQGVVRFAAFTSVLLAWRGRKLMLGLAYAVVLAGLLLDAGGALAVTRGSSAETALERQRVLFEDPLTDDGLSGRPLIWTRTIAVLNDHPRFYFTGAGLGSYVEYGGASHNMILQLLLEGGVIALLLYVTCYGAMFRRLWIIRDRAWPLVAATVALLTSLMTSEVFYPTLATGWYLGLYFVSLQVASGMPPRGLASRRAAPVRLPEGTG